MKKNLIFGVPTLVSMLILLSSWNSYELSAFAPVTASEEHGVFITSKAYTPEESKKYLDRDLQSRGYQPVQVTIQNNTADTFLYNEESVSLPSASPGKIALKVSKSALPRAIGYKVAGMLFWPFMIPGTIDTIRTFKAHKLMKKDYKARAIKEEAISPYSTVHRMIYVPMDEFKETFTIELTDFSTLRSKTYEVHAIG